MTPGTVVVAAIASCNCKSTLIHMDIIACKRDLPSTVVRYLDAVAIQTHEPTSDAFFD